MAEIVIIGAGLTGLATAYYLEKNGFSDYIIVEQNSRAGGLLRSEHEKGFTFDYTGHWIHCNNQLFSDFLADVIGCKHMARFQRNAGIFSHDTITTYPFQINLYGLPTNVVVDCIESYVTRPCNKIRKPSSFHNWVLKHFGSGFGKHFFFPYNRKLLAYDLKKVHHSWTGRFVPSTTLHDIIQGTIAPEPLCNVGYNSTFQYPKKGGIEALITGVLKKISQPMYTNKTVTYLDVAAKKIFFSDGTNQRYNILVSTMPLNKLLSCSSSATLQVIAPKLHCNSVINYNLGCNVPLTEKFHWLYFPEKHFAWYRLGFWNNISTSLAPHQHASLYAEYSYLPGTKARTLRTKTIDLIRSQLMTFFNLHRSNIVVEKTLTLEHAYVIYDAWREKHIANLLAQLAADHIFSIGRYGAWKYASMQEAVVDGYNAAQSIQQSLGKAANNIHPVTQSKHESLRKKQIDVTTN